MIDPYKMQQYPILIHYEETLPQPNSRDVAIIDRSVYSFFSAELPFEEENIFLYKATETNKTLAELEKVLAWLKKKQLSRSDTIWGIGGGITTDFAACVASLFKRGCKLTLVPSTFLGMIDAAIGGKTALNFGRQKNFIGTFYPAQHVFIQTKWLSKLSEKEKQNGWVELCKIALISPSALYEKILAEKKINLELIRLAIQKKMEFCQIDPFDRNQRRLLNLGHTFGHALETVSNFEMSHGECVFWGMKAAARWSRKMRYLTPELEAKINRLLDIVQIKSITEQIVHNLSSEFDPTLFYQDKKADSHVNLILFNGFQSCFVYSTDKVHLIKKALEEVIYETL